MIRITASLLIISLTTATLQAQDSLQETLDERKASYRANMSPEAIAEGQHTLDNLRATGILSRALKEGDKAPNYWLRNATGEWVSLEKQLENGPVVAVFYRGGWCPYCNLTLAAYQERLQEIRAEGAQLVAISPEPPDQSMSTKEKQNLAFEVLSDTNNDLARQFRIVYPLDRDTAQRYLDWGIPIEVKKGNEGVYELPLAATYLIDTDRTIRWAFLDVDYTQRAEPQTILNEIAKLN